METSWETWMCDCESRRTMWNMIAHAFSLSSLLLQLSRIYHPDAPSTSTSDSVESRIARFQAISSSYAVLGDDRLRKEYDMTLGSFGGRRGGGYTSGRANEPANMRSSWSPGENTARRERANYAWQHPQKRNGPQTYTTRPAGANQPNPFSRRERDGFPATDHYHRFATQDARTRQKMAAANSHSRSGSSQTFVGVDTFGEKADEVSKISTPSPRITRADTFVICLLTNRRVD